MQQRMILPNRRPEDLSIALQVQEGPSGGLWLCSEMISGRAEPITIEVSRWSPADLLIASDWFQTVADAEEETQTRSMWFGTPGIAFGLIETGPDLRAIDICLTTGVSASWPQMTGYNCESTAGDDIWTYVTVDVSADDCQTAAAVWRESAQEYGHTPVKPS